jgi:small-conductance mechanosensitive channel
VPALMEFKTWIADPVLRAAIILAATVVAAFLVQWVVHAIVSSLVSRTANDLDDKIYALLKRPILISLIMGGFLWIATDLLPAGLLFVVSGVLKSLAIALWVLAAMRISTLTFTVLGNRSGGVGALQPRTVPAYDMLVKVSVLAAGAYGAFIIWNLDLTGWMASAGIAGIAVGFAAKDSLANLFAGLLIMADAPYKVGDYVVIEGGLRGKVTQMGMRSTRLLTRDDVEITVPNSLIGNSRILNEDGGPHVKQRVRIPVSVAYGSDVDEVCRVLLTCPPGVEFVCKSPEPRVRFRAFGDSGLLFELLVWTDRAEERGRLIDWLNTKVYKAFAAAGIEIPYSKHDVYIKQIPDSLRFRIGG